MEIRPAFEADHIAPAVFLIGLDPLRNRGGLGLPELVRISEYAMLTEQVGRHLSLIGIKVEQRLVGRDRGPARDPCLAESPHRRAVCFALEQSKPFGLLVGRRKRQRADRFTVKLVLGVEFPDRFGERSKREHTAHKKLSYPKERPDILHRLAFVVQALERFILLHLGRWQASYILDDGGGNRGRRILLGHDRAGDQRRLACLLGDFFQREEAAASGDDAIILALAADQQSLPQTALAD